MMHGEYESMKAITEFSADFAPRPIDRGTFASDSDMHFLLMEFREMDQEVPEMEPTCVALANMHLKSHSAGIQKFGFHVTTHNGSLA